ncbi:unnamed protein product [Rotaria magnacalcarata]
MESLKINADFVGSRIVYDLPSTVFSNITSLHLESLKGDDLAYVLEQATQLNHLTLNNVNDTNIKRVFEKYLNRLQSFMWDSSLPTQMAFPLDPYILSTFSVVLYQLSDLLVFIVHIPQLKHLKLYMFENFSVDEAERLRLLQMIKSTDMNMLSNIETFMFMSRINFTPWSIFVRLVRSMIRLRTLSFDYFIRSAPPPHNVHRYTEIDDDENWNSSAADYLSTVLQSLKELINISFRLSIHDCDEKPNESRCFIVSAKDESDIGEFARLSRCFPKIQRLIIQWPRSISPPQFQGIAQPLMHCGVFATCSTTSGGLFSRMLPFLPKLRVIELWGGIDQLTALATFQSSTLVRLNVFSWIDASIDFLDETYFPSLQFLFIFLFNEAASDEILRIERTIERSFTHLPNLISLHYYSFKTNYDFTHIIKPSQYSSFHNVHIENNRIIVWK